MGWLDSAIATAGQKWLNDMLKKNNLNLDQVVADIKEFQLMKPALLELLARHEHETPTPIDPVEPPPAPPYIPPQPPVEEELKLVNISWLGTSVSDMAPVTAKILSASTDGHQLFTVYNAYSWPSNNTPPKPCDALCYFFYEKDGKVVGGKFDWWKNGGQGSKGLKNVHEGYHGHSMPAKGTKCWTMISDIHGKQRSNICKVTWK